MTTPPKENKKNDILAKEEKKCEQVQIFLKKYITLQN
jgi:hypothetical protein